MDQSHDHVHRQDSSRPRDAHIVEHVEVSHAIFLDLLLWFCCQSVEFGARRTNLIPDLLEGSQWFATALILSVAFFDSLLRRFPQREASRGPLAHRIHHSYWSPGGGACSRT